MTRFKIWCGVSLLFILLFIGGAIVSKTAGASSLPSKNSQPTTIPTFQVSQSYVVGVPAIPVHTSSGVTTNAANNSSTPAFTQADVTTFLNQHPFYAGALVPGAHLKILTIQFVTAKQASSLMKGESVGRPDDYLICYAKVQGPFQLQNVERPRSRPGTTPTTTAEIGDVVFDAHTGNMLVWGVY